MSASLVARRAIEALRNGVPNPFAVAELGFWQQEVEEKFWELCNAPSLEPGGMLVKGDFGTGKSHLLLNRKKQRSRVLPLRWLSSLKSCLLAILVA